MRVFLTSERLLLRHFTPADVDGLAAVDGDPEVMHYLNGGQPIAYELVRDQGLPRLLEWHARGDDFGYFAAVERTSGVFLGWFHWRPATTVEPGVIELGYRLRRSAWGQGYATEGARALLHKGFVEQGVPRVIAMTTAAHAASRRVMEKAGLRFERPFVFEGPAGAWHTGLEGVLYGLNRADYQPTGRT